MPAKNITLAVDEVDLASARQYAAARSTTVNALVRDFIAGLNEKDRLRRAAVERMIARSKSTAPTLGAITWTRDDLYDRGPEGSR